METLAAQPSGRGPSGTSVTSTTNSSLLVCEPAAGSSGSGLKLEMDDNEIDIDMAMLDGAMQSLDDAEFFEDSEFFLGDMSAEQLESIMLGQLGDEVGVDAVKDTARADRVQPAAAEPATEQEGRDRSGGDSEAAVSLIDLGGARGRSRSPNGGECSELLAEILFAHQQDMRAAWQTIVNVRTFTHCNQLVPR